MNLGGTTTIKNLEFSKDGIHRVISSPEMADILKAGNESIVTSVLNSNELHLSDFAETI